MRKPPAIRPGDTLSIVSPSSATTKEKLQNAKDLLEDRGYKLKFAPHAFERNDFLAGTDEQRAEDLQEAWFDPETTAVICARGGYGMGRLLPLLDLDRMAEHPKLLVGFSDVTALHLALNRRGLATLHAPMLLSFVREREDWVKQMWFDAMEGNPLRPITAEPLPSAVRSPQSAVQGLTTGGCLCLLCDSLATPDALDTSSKIVLIEDVDEPPHRIDAMLTHLLNAGLLQKAAAIVIGEFTGSDEKVDEGIGGKPWKEIVQERLEKLDIPIVIDFPFGHAKDMASLPLGITATLENGTLTYKESVVTPR